MEKPSTLNVAELRNTASKQNLASHTERNDAIKGDSNMIANSEIANYSTFNKSRHSV